MLGLAWALLPAVQAAENGVTEADRGVRTFSRLEGLFDVDLPRTIEKYDVRFVLKPHFGDFLHRSYLRIPFGMRAGINDHTELNAELDTYVTHGLRSGSEGLGFSAFHLGAKYQWLHWLRPEIETSTGFNSTIPLGSPPLELTDGYAHFSPYVVFSRELESLPNFAPFVSLSTDWVIRSSIPGEVPRNRWATHSMGISPGFIFERGDFKYSLVTTYMTSSLVGRGSYNYYSINPSVLWQVPPGLLRGLPGTWVFGMGVKWEEGPDDSDLKLSAKLRGEFDLPRLRSLWRRDRD